MAVKLSKGQKVDLTKTNPNLKNIIVGLGWQPQASSSYSFDIDASAFLLRVSGKVENDQDFVFYNNPSGGQGSVIHSGDNKRGSGDGDAEQIQINLHSIPSHIDKIAFTITINDAQVKRQSFGDIKNSYVRVVNSDNNELLLQYELGQEFSVETALVAAELYRHNGEWKFNALGSGFRGGLAALCRNFGLEVEEDRNASQSVNRQQSHYQAPPGLKNQSSDYRSQPSPPPSSYQPSYAQPSQGGYTQGGYTQENSGLQCPRCQSSQVTAGKKGFGLGKAALGGILLGPVGMLAGFVGSKNMEFACRSCGDRWSGANNTNASQWMQKQTESARNVVNKYMGQDLTEALVAGGALVSMADGVLDPSEQNKLIQYFQTSQEMKGININEVTSRFDYFVQRLQFDFMMGKAEALRAIGKLASKPEAARLVVRFCCAIGYADGEFAPVEKQIVEEICREVYLDPREFVY